MGEFGIHLFHGGGIAQCADGGQVVVGIAPQGGVSAFGRVQAAFVAPLCRQAAVQRFVELRQGLAVVQLVFRLPCGVGVVRNKSRAETMIFLPCGRNVAGGRQGGFEGAAVFGGGRDAGLPANDLQGELPRYGGVQAACAGAEYDVAARKRAVRRADAPLAAFAVVGGFFNIVFGQQADVRVVQKLFD